MRKVLHYVFVIFRGFFHTKLKLNKRKTSKQAADAKYDIAGITVNISNEGLIA